MLTPLPLTPWHLEHAALTSSLGAKVDGSGGTTRAAECTSRTPMGRERDRRNCERVGRELFHQKSIHSPNIQVLLFPALILGKPGELGKVALLRLKGLWLLATT